VLIAWLPVGVADRTLSRPVCVPQPTGCASHRCCPPQGLLLGAMFENRLDKIPLLTELVSSAGDPTEAMNSLFKNTPQTQN